jgi:glycosyltransferase involved in cell wall biosynthesis
MLDSHAAAVGGPVAQGLTGTIVEVERMTEVAEAAAQPTPAGRLLTVGIPVYNGKALLRNCLQSVIDSTLPRSRFEIVVVDDGSTERQTLAILGEFEHSLAADPGFFRVIMQGANSGGAARPRNRIIDEATGDYIFFLDSDDTIGDAALERIATAVATTPADWVALHQVPVNGRGAVCVVRQPQVEVPRTKALSTLTVHKVFRRAEIERQGLRFDELLPSGQDVSFAFSYIVNAERFLMLGGYDYYYLIKHTDNPEEPAHLSRRDSTAKALIERNERILRSMLTALRESDLPESEQRTILSQVTLPRVLMRQGYLKAIVNAGPLTGGRALHRLSTLLADPLVAGLDPADLTMISPEHLARIANTDWAGLAILLSPVGPRSPARVGLTDRVAARGRRLLDVASGRTRHRRLVNELTLLRRSVEDLRQAQGRLETSLQAEFGLRDHTRRTSVD